MRVVDEKYAAWGEYVLFDEVYPGKYFLKCFYKVKENCIAFGKTSVQVAAGEMAEADLTLAANRISKIDSYSVDIPDEFPTEQDLDFLINEKEIFEIELSNGWTEKVRARDLGIEVKKIAAVDKENNCSQITLSWICNNEITIEKTVKVLGGTAADDICIKTTTYNGEEVTVYKFVNVTGDTLSEYICARGNNTVTNSREKKVIVDLSECTVTNLSTSSYWFGPGLVKVIMPDGLEDISGQMFQSCSNLDCIEISESNVKYSCENGVLYDKDKTKIIKYPAAKKDVSFTLPDTVRTAAYGVFEKAACLKEITNFEIVTKLESMQCFNGCGIKTVKLNSSLTSLPSYTFDSSHIESITIPASIQRIEGDCFSGCADLKLFIMERTTPPTFGTANGNPCFYNCNADLKIYVPKGSAESYKNAAGWSAVSDKIYELDN